MERRALNPLRDSEAEPDANLPSIIKDAWRWLRDHGSTIVFACVACLPLFTLIKKNATFLGYAVSDVEVVTTVALGLAGVAGSWYASDRRAKLRADYREALDDLEEALDRAQEVDSTLGRVLEQTTREHFERFQLCGNDRLTIYGRSEVGEKHVFIKLARYSADPVNAKAGRDVLPDEGFLATAWREGSLAVQVNKSTRRQDHRDGGLMDNKVYENLTMKAHSYRAFRLNEPHGDAVGVMMFEGHANGCHDQHAKKLTLDRHRAMSLAQLIVAATKHAEREGNHVG